MSGLIATSGRIYVRLQEILPKFLRRSSKYMSWITEVLRITCHHTVLTVYIFILGREFGFEYLRFRLNLDGGV